MKSEPLVSILINNYNYCRLLSSAIDSALNQTYPHTEVIVVDDGSTDDSRDLIKDYGNQIVPILKENGGQASAINAGFEASKGDIVCLLDADDMFLPNKVDEVVKIFQRDPCADWVFTESFPLKSNNLTNKTVYDIFSADLEKVRNAVAQKIDFRNEISNGILPDFTPSTSNLCFSRVLLDKIMPLPEVKGSSGIAICDTYLKYVAVGLGWGFSFPKDLGIFRLHDSNLFSGKEVEKKRITFSEIFMATGYWMFVRHPELQKLSKKLFAKGLGVHWKNKDQNSLCRHLFDSYLPKFSSIEQAEILAMSLYYFIKLYYVEII